MLRFYCKGCKKVKRARSFVVPIKWWAINPPAERKGICRRCHKKGRS